jgi:hypothetical protein
MGLSSWPDDWDDEEDDETVVVEFPDGMTIVARSDKAIGLAVQEWGDVTLWLPISKLPNGEPPEKWVYEIELPEWLAIENGLIDDGD